MTPRPRLLLFLLALLLLAGTAFGDVLHLRGGGSIEVAQWWEEGGTLFYQTDAGVIGLPRTDVLRIESTPPRKTPSFRGEPASEPAPAASETPPDAKEKAAPSRAASIPDEEQLTASIDRLGEELRRAGSPGLRQRIEKGLADLHVLRARRRFRGGETDGAVADYERALALAHDHRLAAIELSWVLLRRGDLPWARRIVETALASYPDDGHLLELQGELFYRDNRLPDARQSYTLALARRPGDTRLRGRLEKIERELKTERDYQRADSQHFILRYDGQRDEDLGGLLLSVLEQAWDDLTAELDAFPLEPITVILYTEKEFRVTTRTGPEVAGLFDGKIRLPVGGVTRITPGLIRVARHELVHALLHVKGRGRVPRWLHEGLAQFLEPRPPEGVRAALALAASRGKRIGIDPFSYPTALSFVGFLEERYSHTRLLWVIELLAQGKDEDLAFLEGMGARREELIEEWRSWLSSRN